MKSSSWRALIARGMAFLLILTTAPMAFGEEAEPLSAEQIAAVMRCLLPQARGEGWHGEELQARYYQPEQLVSYGRAIRRAVELNGLDERYVAVMVGTLYQQSKFQYDAVSRHNRDDEGELMAPNEDAWQEPQDGMDYGIFQHHWPLIWVPTIPPWNGSRKPTLEELRASAATLLAHHKLPEALHLLDAMPLTAMDKVDKAALRRRLD